MNASDDPVPHPDRVVDTSDVFQLVDDLGRVFQTVFDEFDAGTGRDREVVNWVLVAETVDRSGGPSSVSVLPASRELTAPTVGLLDMARDVAKRSTGVHRFGGEHL